jgi:hypothetical protein
MKVIDCQRVRKQNAPETSRFGTSRKRKAALEAPGKRGRVCSVENLESFGLERGKGVKRGEERGKGVKRGKGVRFEWHGL